MKPIRLAAAAALLACAASISVAQQMVPNPEFASWGKFPKGTTVTYKFSGDVWVERKLLRADANTVVVEKTGITKLDGKEFRSKAKEEEVPKMTTSTLTTAGQLQPWMVGKGKAPAGWKAGEEKLKIGDTEVKTRWYSQFDPKSNFGAKVWVSEEVPGLLVKLDFTSTNPATKKLDTQTFVEVIEVKKAASKP